MTVILALISLQAAFGADTRRRRHPARAKRRPRPGHFRRRAGVDSQRQATAGHLRRRHRHHKQQRYSNADLAVLIFPAADDPNGIKRGRHASQTLRCERQNRQQKDRDA